MKCNIKFLILTVNIIACINNSYINAMDLSDEEEISNNIINTNLNNINNIIINNTDNEEKEIYSHLFDKNYNKEKYNTLCAECINNIKHNKPEYIGLMNNTTEAFDNILSTFDWIISDIFKSESDEEELEVSPSELPDMDILHVITIAKQFNIFDDLKDKQDVLLSNTSELSEISELPDATKKLIQATKKDLISFEELFNYINNQIIKLKYKTLKKLEQSILNTNPKIDILYTLLNDVNPKSTIYNKIQNQINTHYDNIENALLAIQKLKDDQNITNEEIKQIDDFIYNAIYNINKDQISIIQKVKEALNILPEYTGCLNSAINDTYSDMRHYINSFDNIYFTKSTFQKRFNNLYTKVIDTFNRMSNDNSFNDQTRLIDQNAYMYGFISKFLLNTEDNNTNYLRNILNNILFNGHGRAYFHAKDYFRKIVQILNITKKIMDNKTQRNLIKMHDPLYKDTNQKADVILNYMLLLYEVVEQYEEDHNKYVIQCKDFIKQFESMYNFYLPSSIRKYEVVLIYPDNKSPKQTVKQVLDNPDGNFIIPYNEVRNLQSKKDWGQLHLEK